MIRIRHAAYEGKVIFKIKLTLNNSFSAHKAAMNGISSTKVYQYSVFRIAWNFFNLRETLFNVVYRFTNAQSAIDRYFTFVAFCISRKCLTKQEMALVFNFAQIIYDGNFSERVDILFKVLI